MFTHMNPDAPTRRGEGARRRLERAALRCFVKRGVDAATTKEIARAAQMAEGNLYRHFPSKEDLAWALYERHLIRFTGALDEAARKGGGSRARLKALVHRFRLLFEEEPDVYTYIVLAQHGLTARTPPSLRTPTDVVAEVLSAGQRHGEVRKGDPLLLATMLVGLVARLTLLKIHGRLREGLDELEREAAGACWRVAAK